MESALEYLPKLIEKLIVRLKKASAPGEESDSIYSSAAMAHGTMRKLQGYTPAMLVHDSRILQVTLFEMLQSNLGALDFSLLLPDVMKIAVEVGFAVDAGDGELHERHGEASGGVALLHCTRSTSRYSATNGNTASWFPAPVESAH